MLNVLSEIADWAQNLAYWEQIALDKVIAGESFAEEDYEVLLQYLLEDAGLSQPTLERPLPRLHKKIPLELDAQRPVKLMGITNLNNVNALVSHQTLTFSPALTAIFGANGSGKSGYARVLGSAGFTRGDREVLPDVTRPVEGSRILSADIELSIDGQDQVLHYRVGKPSPELVSFYVFDSTSVRVHMCEQNPLSFSPAGLSYLTRMADVTDEVRARLRKLIEACSQPCEVLYLFQGDSEVSQILATLGPQTDVSRLKQLAALTTAEKKRKHELEIEIANIALDKFWKEIAELKFKISGLQAFKWQLSEAEEQLNDERITGINQEIGAHQRLQKAAEQSSEEQFRTDFFGQTGTPTWHRFIEAARRLAEVEETDNQPYPQPTSRCLLCHQPLDPEALDLLKRLWAFLEGEARRRLTDSEHSLVQISARITSLDLFKLSLDLSSPYQVLQEVDPKLFNKVKDFINGYRERREALSVGLAGKQPVKLPAAPETCLPELEGSIAALLQRLSRLEAKDLEAELRKLEGEKRELAHRELLESALPQILDYVENCAWAQHAAKAIGSTYHITKKHNDLFDQLVTKRYEALFEKTLLDLGRPMKVNVETHGKKGQTIKQVVLQADRSASSIAKPEKVLSEGEKRAVALADFLTEVALDTTSSGIILDDPVTSLDLEWRVTIADILVREARNRQVIVFTHDLPFLYHVKNKADQENIETQTHWIKRGDSDNKPGYVFLNNSPALERDYRKSTKAQECYKKAKEAPAELQEIYLKEGFGALRTSYEAFIIFDLLNEVVTRFGEKISFGRLNEIAWDASIANEVVEACSRLSRYIEGHLHSDAYAAFKPMPKTLIDEIQIFDDLRRRLKELKEV